MQERTESTESGRLTYFVDNGRALEDMHCKRSSDIGFIKKGRNSLGKRHNNSDQWM